MRNTATRLYPEACLFYDSRYEYSEPRSKTWFRKHIERLVGGQNYSVVGKVKNRVLFKGENITEFQDDEIVFHTYLPNLSCRIAKAM